MITVQLTEEMFLTILKTVSDLINQNFTENDKKNLDVMFQIYNALIEGYKKG